MPEPKTVKNRMHFDVARRHRRAADGRECAAGADARTTTEVEWDVLADPEGNEFCVFAPEG